MHCAPSKNNPRVRLETDYFRHQDKQILQAVNRTSMSEEQYDITLTLPTMTQEQSAAGTGPTDSLSTHQNAGLSRALGNN